MDLPVFRQEGVVSEALPTICTGKRLLTRMNTAVFDQGGLQWKTLATILTGKRLFTCVKSLVVFQL